jgi:N-acyl-L-homoserine lactone synthetase
MSEPPRMTGKTYQADKPFRTMRGHRRYVFKIAETPQELADVHRLLYRTFVLEIPRYDDPGTDFLVDKYHERNVYFVAVRKGRVCGMTAVHDQPPFSAAAALDNPNVLLKLTPRLLEARILAVNPRERFGVVFAGLACSVHEYAKSSDYRYIVITGLTERQGMYERMGFRPLGPPRLRGNRHFVPMALDVSRLSKKVKWDLDRWNCRVGALAKEK